MRALLVAQADSPACEQARQLAATASLRLLDRAGTAAEALTMTLALKPELLLLDPGLTPVNAAELAASLHEPTPQLVWLTHDVVQRCSEAGSDRQAAALLMSLPRRRLGVEVGRLMVLEQGRVHSLALDEIRWMELPDRRRPALLLHGFSERHLLPRRLHGLLTDLPPGRMLRCHPRVAVAPAHVLEALPRAVRGATLLLDNGMRLACGTQFWPAWQAALQTLGKRIAPGLAAA